MAPTCAQFFKPAPQVRKLLHAARSQQRADSCREQLGAAPGVSPMWGSLAWATQIPVRCVRVGGLMAAAQE
jgi:hypothetical protein